MTPHDDTTTAITDHIIGALGDAVASIGGDDAATDRVGPHLDAITTAGGAAALYAAMCAWSTITQSETGNRPTGALWTISAINPATGEEVDIDHASPAGRSAARIMAAILNNDHRNADSPFAAALEAGDGEAVVLRVLHAHAWSIHHTRHQ